MKQTKTLKTICALVLGALAITTTSLKALGPVTVTAEPIDAVFFNIASSATPSDGTVSLLSGPDVEDIIQYSAMAGVPTGSTVFPGFTTSTATSEAALPAGETGTIQLYGLKTTGLGNETASSILTDQVYLGLAMVTVGQDGHTLFSQGTSEDVGLQGFVNQTYNAFGFVNNSFTETLVGSGTADANTLQGVVLPAVPEPSTWVLVGIMSLIWVQRIRKRA